MSARRTPSYAGESKRNYIEKKPSGRMEVAAGQLQQESPGGFFDERKRYWKFAAYNIEMRIPYRIRTQIQRASNIWTDQERHRTDTPKMMRSKRRGNHRSRGMSRPYTHANQHTAQVQCITNYGVSQREKQSHDFRPACEFKIQVRRPAFLGKRGTTWTQ